MVRTRGAWPNLQAKTHNRVPALDFVFDEKCWICLANMSSISESI
jgi:hypothetical protein